MRYKKTVNGKTTEYYMDGSRIWMENRIGDGGKIYYVYDASGVAGMIYQGTRYFFDKNTLGDIVAIWDSAGNLMGRYSYDAWGNITYQSGSMASVNPFRYRGYYYDTETGFYYLQTRYYDPTICRFINADNYELVAELSNVAGQLNLYAYANNNPIMMTDPTGEIVILATLLIGAFIGAASAFSIEVISQGVTKGFDNIDWGDVIIQTVSGAVFGAVSAAVPGIGGAFAKAGISGLTKVATGLYHGDTVCNIIGEALLSAGATFGLGLISNTDITAFSKGKWVDYVSDSVFDFDLVRLNVSDAMIRYISIAAPIYMKGLKKMIG